MLAAVAHAVDQQQPAEALLLIKPLRQEAVIADIPEVQLNKKLLLIVRQGQKDLPAELKGLNRLMTEEHHLLQHARVGLRPMKK